MAPPARRARVRRGGETPRRREPHTLSMRNGPGEGGCMLHNARYDFNDQILPLGASYWANLVEHSLAAET